MIKTPLSSKDDTPGKKFNRDNRKKESLAPFTSGKEKEEAKRRLTSEGEPQKKELARGS